MLGIGKADFDEAYSAFLDEQGSHVSVHWYQHVGLGVEKC